MKEITHHDEVYGDVDYDPMAVALLDTPSMQRLGRVYQLGYSHLVYRSANHTRLSHVLGAYKAASDLVDALRRNYSRKRAWPNGAIDPDSFLPCKKGNLEDRWEALRYFVCWAGLLHDIGHVPLGHTLEDEYAGIYAKHDDFASPRIPFLWFETSPGCASDIRKVLTDSDLYPKEFSKLGLDEETVWSTVMLICLHKEETKEEKRLSFSEIIEAADDSNSFVILLRKALQAAQNVFFPYMADIVGNTICADYLDYLKRDARNLGLEVVKDDRVTSQFWVGKSDVGLMRMALPLVTRKGKPKADNITGVEELVRQRYRLAEMVYYHKTKVAASAMLAKVFQLIGKPNELRINGKVIIPNEIDSLLKDIFSKGKSQRAAAAADLRERAEPSALLDPEIGDENLHMLLAGRAWTRFEGFVLNGEKEKAKECLRAVALLQAIARRQLYKVCLTIDPDTFANLGNGSRETETVEKRIKDNILALRADSDRRHQLETEIASAYGQEGTDDAFVLYTPPRKVQAKGIETGALDGGQVIMLGKHDAVSKQVEYLSNKYKRLWKMIVYVRPDLMDDVVALSNAVDTLLRRLVPEISFTDEATIGVIQKAAWFEYVKSERRSAAREYVRLNGKVGLDWNCFEKSRFTASGSITDQEHADRAVLVSLLRKRNDKPWDIVTKAFPNPNSLTQRIEEINETIVIEAREGVTPELKRCEILRQVSKTLLFELE